MDPGFRMKTVSKAKGECVKGKVVGVKTTKLPVWRYSIRYKCISCDADSSTSEFKNLKEARCVLGSVVLQPCEHCGEPKDEVDSDTDDSENSDDSDDSEDDTPTYHTSGYVTLTRL
jgi:hypothetical protein